MEPLPIDGSEQIPEMVAYTQDLPLGPTHCDRPMLWALEQQEDFDVFIVLTDYDVGWQKVTSVSHQSVLTRNDTCRTGTSALCNDIAWSMMFRMLAWLSSA